MKLYAVFQEGVYRHHCGGVYGSLEAAIAAADDIAANDQDSYHSYEVVPFTLNARVKDELEEDRLYSVVKSEALKKSAGQA